MDSYVTEEQQVEAIKHWLKENGTSILIGATLGLAIVFGVRTWNEWRNGTIETAAQLYQQVVVGLQKNNPALVQQAGIRLMEEYPSSVYAFLGALAQAAAFTEKGDLASARGRLEWVALQVSDPNLKALAQLRLGRLLLDQGDPDRALTLASAAALGGFPAEAAELRGDVLRRQGDIPGARNAYQDAVTQHPPQSTVARDLRMKIDNLGIEESKTP